MKYVCPICGYFYDEEKEGVLFRELSDDWKCPICGAEKNAFSILEDVKIKDEKKEIKQETVFESETEELEKLSIGELAAICSNLARGCEKQYMPKESELYKTLASYFDSIAPAVENNTVEELSKKLQCDVNGYKDLKDVAVLNNDRGAQRVCVWGEKVTRMLSNLVERYLRDGEKMLENTNVWVCSVCGFVYVGENAPELCPVCKVPAWKFDKIEGGNR